MSGVARLGPVTHSWPLSPSPDAMSSSRPRHRRPPASPGACPSVSGRTGEDMGTSLGPLGPCPSSSLGGAGGCWRAQSSCRGVSPSSQGFSSPLCCSLQPRSLYQRCSSCVWCQPELRLGGDLVPSVKGVPKIKPWSWDSSAPASCCPLQRAPGPVTAVGSSWGCGERADLAGLDGQGSPAAAGGGGTRPEPLPGTAG